MTKMYLSERNFDFLRGWKGVGEKGGDPGFRSEISLEIAREGGKLYKEENL